MNEAHRTAWFEGHDAALAGGKQKCPYEEGSDLSLHNAWRDGYREGARKRPSEYEMADDHRHHVDALAAHRRELHREQGEPT